MGYVLPWGQMSYWGAQVIISLFGAIPYVGDAIVEWVRGDYLISGITLNRFMSLHVVLIPLVLVALVVLHVLALHEVGSNNPDGINIKEKKDENGVPLDGVPFYPYYLPIHDLKAIVVFLFVFCAIIFYFPEMGGYFLEHANFEQANPLKTPAHIAPVWYFTPFYSMLRAVNFDIFFIEAKLGGFMAMGAAIAILFVLPWLDKSPVNSIRYRGPLAKAMLLMFAASFIILGYLGVQTPTDGRTLLAQLCMVFYFAYFICMPAWTNPNFLSKFWQYVLCGIYALIFLALAFVDLKTGKIYGQTLDGVKIAHPSIILQGITLAFAAFFFALPKLTERNPIGEPPERVTMRGLGFLPFLGGFLVVLVLSIIPIVAVGAETEYHCGTIECEHVTVDPSDTASLQSGAKWYMNYCYGCHSLQYARYQRVAEDLQIPESIMLDNLVFGDQKIGDLMENSMLDEDAKLFFGVVPPDLTLVSRVRQPEWVYTYLLTFYEDSSRPMGVNNKVFPDVGMPHALLELQGLQACAPGPVKAHNGGYEQDPLTGDLLLKDPCGRFDLVEEGSMSAEEYEQAVYDITNFLAYMAEPMAQERRELGASVLLFLAVLFVLVWLLDREYWRELH